MSASELTRMRLHSRDPEALERLLDAIGRETTRPFRIMEVCGGQTHSLVRSGIDERLPALLTLVHGPGCPVCVTSLELIDRAHAIASRPDVTFCSFGDMLRVPGSHGDLLAQKARGADVRIVYSPLDALRIAEQDPTRKVVFFAIGFETTAPANATAIWLAKRRGVTNFSALVAHVLTPPAIDAILEDDDCRVDGFLAPGHVCTITGGSAYGDLARRHRVPIVITGFEPRDLLEGILMLVRQLEAGRHELENQYARSATASGNPDALRIVDEVFEVCDRKWRGVGSLARSGLALRDAYAAHDAARLYEVEAIVADEPAACISGQILRGIRKPTDCPAFGTACTPDTPLGATMVSSEGACAAYHACGRKRAAPAEEIAP